MAQARSKAHLSYGQALRHFRAERGISQEELANLADLDRTYVSGVERGERNPTLASLLRLVKALDIPLSELAIRAETTRRRN
jgi:transcriptional regulator with XRE-family HTH domain